MKDYPERLRFGKNEPARRAPITCISVAPATVQAYVNAMMALTFPHIAAAGLLAGSIVFLSPSSAPAADETAWDGDANSAMRLVASVGGAHEAAGFQVGLEIRLAPGWKTYWRYPGDSGVPPRFDFSRSQNVKDVTVLWPAPARFNDGSGSAIGYAANVVFPLRVVPINPQAPSVVTVKIDYGVCEKVCIPVDATATLTLSPQGSVHGRRLRAAESRVPRPTTLAAAGALAVSAVHMERGERPRVVVDVKAPDGAAVDLFAEGPSADWALPLPEPIAGGAAGTRRFAFELDGLPSGASAKDARLTLTAVTADDAIEVAIRLD